MEKSLSPDPEDENIEYFSCGKCDKVFKKKNSLQVHEKTHEPRKFHCHVCGFAFTRPYLLKRHLERVHDPSRDAKVKIKDEASEPLIEETQDKNSSHSKEDLSDHKPMEGSLIKALKALPKKLSQKPITIIVVNS